MNMNPFVKTGALILVAFALATALAATSALAYPSNPYSGVNTIGSAWQQTSTHYVSYTYGNARWGVPGYVSAPRTAGYVGDSIEFAWGLRAPVYAPMPQMYQSQYYVAACPWPTCHLGAAGYPRMRSSQYANTGSFGAFA